MFDQLGDKAKVALVLVGLALLSALLAIAYDGPRMSPMGPGPINTKPLWGGDRGIQVPMDSTDTSMNVPFEGDDNGIYTDPSGGNGSASDSDA